MRQFLVTKMVCTDCGGTLQLSYDLPNQVQHADGEPTGALMVSQIVAVKPCQHCLKPLAKTREAVIALMELTGTVKVQNHD